MRVAVLTTSLVATITLVGAQPAVDDRASIEKAIRVAFAGLYALPPDTSAAKMGSWVLDTTATTLQGEATGRWTVAVTKLTDTGQDLKLVEELSRVNGTSPRQLEQSFLAMQRLEGKISKAEADSRLEVIVQVNEPLSVSGVSDDALRQPAAIPGAAVALQIAGDWMRVDDRELEIDYERWSPATLLVGFGRFEAIQSRRASPKDSAATFTANRGLSSPPSPVDTLTIVAQGNDEMIARLVRDSNWNALAALVNPH